MIETTNSESRKQSLERMETFAIKEFGHGYVPCNDFSELDKKELQRLASIAWLRMETEDIKQLIGELNRRNNLLEPPTETYDSLVQWMLQQRSHFPIIFGVPVPSIGVYWAYGKHVLTNSDFASSSIIIHEERDRYILNSDEFRHGVYDDS